MTSVSSGVLNGLFPGDSVNFMGMAEMSRYEIAWEFRWCVENREPEGVSVEAAL